MRFIQSILIMLLVISVSGCTALIEGNPTTEEHRNECIVGAATFGAVIGGIITTPLGAGAGMAAGGALGHHFCGEPAAPVMAEEPDTSGFFHPDDQDLDGVTDNLDLCPFTPEGVAVDSNGCALDGDADGVPDYLDKCLSTPAGNVVDTDGCSLKIVSLQGVHFAFDSSNLTAEAKSILDRAAVTLKSHSASSFTIEGHTDSYGPDAYNQQLSERRANAVKNYLVAQGVSASRLVAVGKGESFPIASNDSRQGRADNRRVDVFAR